MNFDPSALSSFTMIATGFAAAFLAALWLSLILWTYRDIRGRARDPLVRVLAILVVAILFLPGVLIYLILRPGQTIEEEYQHSLEEEALLQSIEEIAQCPGCGRHTETEWIVCPNCHTKLKKACVKCGRLMELPWNLCPFCATPAEGVPVEEEENIFEEEPLEEVQTVEILPETDQEEADQKTLPDIEDLI